MMYLHIGSHIIMQHPKAYMLRGVVPFFQFQDGSIKLHKGNLSKVNAILKTKIPPPFIDNDIELPSFLMPHQKAGILHIIQYKKVPLFFDTGTGKTLTALIAADYLLRHNLIKRVLIVCPKDLMIGSWIEQYDKIKGDFNYDMSAPIVNLWGFIKKVHTASKKTKPKKLADLYSVIGKTRQIFTINYEMFVKYPEMWKEHIDLLIFDESSRLINMLSHTSKVARYVCAYNGIKYVAMLTGTPIHNNEYEYYTQLHCCSHLIWGNKNDYDKHFKFDIYNRPSLRKLASKPFFDTLHNTALFVSADAIELKKPVFANIYTDLTPEQRKDYDKFKQSFLRDRLGIMKKQVVLGVDVTSKSILSDLLRQRQITSGFIQKVDEQTGCSIRFYKKNQRLQSMLNHIARLKGKKHIIWCNYIAEVEMLKKELGGEAVYIYGTKASNKGKGKTTDVEYLKHRFKLSKQEGGVDILVATISKFQYGHNLQFCHYVSFFSRADNYKKEHQAIARCLRKGQDNSVHVYYFMSPNTIDIKLAQMVAQKKAVTDFSYEFFLSDPDSPISQ